jgi:hypothetical protein
MKLMALANSMKTDFNFYETVALFFLSKQSMNEIEYFHLRFETVAMNSAAKTSIGTWQHTLQRISRIYTIAVQTQRQATHFTLISKHP